MSVYQATTAGRSATMSDDTFGGALATLGRWSLLIPLVTFDLVIFATFWAMIAFDIPVENIDRAMLAVSAGLIALGVYGAVAVVKLMRSSWFRREQWWV